MAWMAAIPAITSILSTAGQLFTNKANEKQASRQMDFQREMSNSSAQRAVEDYRKAGLNPALAYDRGASSPTGASAVIGNALQAGVSSAREAASMQQAMKIAREQNDADLKLKRAQENQASAQAAAAAAAATRETTQARVNASQEKILEQQLRFSAINQPFDTRIQAAQALLAELQVPGARNTAAFETMMGRTSKGITTARTAAEIIKLLRGRGH